MPAFLECIAADGRHNIDGQLDLFGFDDPSEGETTGSAVPVPDVEELPKKELMLMERETTGLYLSGHPIDDYKEAARRAGSVNIGSILYDTDFIGIATKTGSLVVQGVQHDEVQILAVELVAKRSQEAHRSCNTPAQAGLPKLCLQNTGLKYAAAFPL